MDKYLRLLSQGDRLGLTLIRLSIAIVFIWIGLLKFVPYEADSITPFVANSPFMSFFYEHPEEYRQHLTHEGELKPEERAWQTANNTYAFSDGLGVVELIIAALVLANPVSRWLGLAGGVLAFLTPFVTLSFLINHAGGLGYAAGRCALWFSVFIGRRAAGIKRYVNAGRCGDDHGGLRPFVTFTAPVATLLPSLCRDSSGGACAIRQCVDE